MKYKYKLTRSDEKKLLIIQEYIKVEGEVPFLACEENYKLESLESTLHEGSDVLKRKLRNSNIYPPSGYMTSLVTTVKDMLTTTNHQNPVEISFDDKEMNASGNYYGNKVNDGTEVTKDCVNIDKLLGDGIVEMEKNETGSKSKQ